ncbi:MAG: cytochrome c oxidase assembly factor Coa1 family protein, partial [Solirubrobacteraceae bacterium]
LLPTTFLVVALPCGCCGGIFWWVIGALKSSEPYQMALHRVQTAPEVIEQIGEPIEEASWMPSGNFNYSNNNGSASGEANFDFSVRGPKGTAHVHAEALCRDGKWRFSVLEATPASTGKAILLRADEKAEREEAGRP